MLHVFDLVCIVRGRVSNVGVELKTVILGRADKERGRLDGGRSVLAKETFPLLRLLGVNLGAFGPKTSRGVCHLEHLVSLRPKGDRVRVQGVDIDPHDGVEQAVHSVMRSEWFEWCQYRARALSQLKIRRHKHAQNIYARE